MTRPHSNLQTNQFVKHCLTNLRYHFILTYHGLTMNAYCVEKMRMQGGGIKYLPTEEELSREIREQKEFFELQKGKEAEDED